MKKRNKRLRGQDANRCQALTYDCYQNPTNDRCRSRVSIQVDDLRLCGRHAAWHSMHLLLKGMIPDVSVLKNGAPITLKPIRIWGEDNLV